MSDIRKTLDKLNEMTAGSVATVATPLFKETVKREKTDETADSGKKYMNSVERGASEWGNWASSKKKKTVAEATNPTTDDDKFKTMLKKVTSKKAVNKQQKADTKQQASDAFASMFGGGNPAGTLGIRKEGVAEGSEQNYLSQIPNLTWKPISRSVWNTIQDEGLDDEQNAPNHTDWLMASLSISPKDAQALQAFDDDAIEDFNRFDIHLKSRYPGLVDLIDYDRGTVTIVKAAKEQGVAEGWKISTPIDKERYTDMSDQGLEGPFRLKSGKIVYYDPKEGKYYDRDTDMYMDYDEYQSHTNEEALMELGYEGNIGAMEMVKFFKMADPRQKEILNQLIKEKEFQRAWALIQGVTGDKLVGKEFSEGEIAEHLSEDLRAWFGKGGEGGAGGGGWDRYNTKGERIGKCGERKAGEGKPKCLSKEKAASLRASGGKKAIAAAVRKKRREDPNPQRQGKADMVSNKTKNESLEYYVKEGICPQCNGEMVSEALFTEGKKDACYHKVKSRYKIWPSAYASGALVKCRKAGAKNWGNKSKNESINEGRADDLERALMQARKITKGITYDNTVNEIMVEIENLVKAYALDMDDFNYHNSRVYEAKHELESAIYGLDEIFEDALRDAQYSDEEGLNEQDLIVMPGKMRMRGDVVKAKHMEPDHEVSMAVNSLLSTVKSAMSLAKIIKGRSEGQGLPGWVSDHITRADELIKDVAEYMEGHEAQKNMLEGKKNVKR